MADNENNDFTNENCQIIGSNNLRLICMVNTADDKPR